jgi:hypothetical protein
MFDTSSELHRERTGTKEYMGERVYNRKTFRNYESIMKLEIVRAKDKD